MLWLTGLTILSLPLYLVRFSVFGLPTTLLEILIYLSFIALLISRPLAYTVERVLPSLKRYGWPIALLLVSGIVSLLIAPSLREALGLFKAYILDPILLAVVVLVIFDTREKFLFGLRALILAGTVAAFSTIVLPANEEGRALGLYLLDPTASPNFIALFLAPISTLALGYAIYQPARFDRILGSAGFILIQIGLYLSGSRGGFLAAGAGAGLLIIHWFIQKNRGSLRYLGYGMMVAFISCLAIGGWLFGKPDLSANPDHRAATSNNLRYEIWRTTVVDIIPSLPVLGTGLGGYQEHFTKVTKHRVNFPEFIAPWARTPHNIFLTFWTNLGLLGLVSLIAILVVFFWPSKTKNLEFKKLGRVIVLAMITLLVHGLVDAAYWKNDLAALFWLLVALRELAAEPTERKG